MEEALAAAGQQALARDLAEARAAAAVGERLLRSPILAVLGQLNAGKSSLVARFLDPANRARLPRGVGAATGTHRFVYWVPQGWLDDPPRLAALEELLAAAHGPGLERLAPDPARAAAQYAAGRDDPARLRLPLLAGDRALDRLGFALLDCPDIQTRDQPGRATVDSPEAGDAAGEAADGVGPSDPANQRLDFLASAARICSALVVVWRRDALRDRLLQDLLSTLRGRLADAALHLAVNFVRPAADEPAATLAEPDLIRLADAHHIPPQRRYLAFDQDIPARADRPGWRELTPTVAFASPAGRDASAHAEPDAGDGFHPRPEFFRVPHPTVAPAFDPAAVPAADLLCELPAQLDLAELQRAQLAARAGEVARLLARADTALRTWAEAENARTAEAHAGLLELCREQFADREGRPLQVPSPQFAGALAAAMTRTAPPLLRGLLRLAAPFEKAVGTARAGLTTLRKALSASRRPTAALRDELEARLQVGGLHLAGADDLARAMQARRWCPATLPLDRLREAWNIVLRDLYDHPVERVDEEALSRLARQLWADLSLGKKFGVGARALLGALGSVAALGGLLIALADGGAVFLGATAIANALHGGLAAAIAAAGTLGAGLAFSTGLLDTNTLPWLARLFALACDHFGLPRRLPGRPAPEVAFLLDPATRRRETRRLPEDPLPRRPIGCALGEVRWIEGGD